MDEKRYLLVTKETLQKIASCFASGEEMVDFARQFSDLIEEVLFSAQLAKRSGFNDDYSKLMVMKQMFMIGVFFRDNLEVLHQFIQAINYTEITKEERDKLVKDNLAGEEWGT